MEKNTYYFSFYHKPSCLVKRPEGEGGPRLTPAGKMAIIIDMRYRDLKEGLFLSRPNRFEAYVELEGARELVHVKNTGRCRELLLEGARVVLSGGGGARRKTRYDLVAVRKRGLGLVNIDSQAPNKVTEEWLRGGRSCFQDLTLIKPEYSYGDSRFDFYLERGKEKILMEVKGCTLEKEGAGYFPDAPTARGTKHLRELAAAAKKGFSCYLAFVIAMPAVKTVLPNNETDPEFAGAFQRARAAGVKILLLRCRVRKDSLDITDWEELSQK